MPETREAIAHRFSHFYIYLYQDPYKDIVIRFDLFNDCMDKHVVPDLPVS